MQQQQQRLAQEHEQAQQAALDDLAERLRADDNPLTQQILSDLRVCAQQLRQLGETQAQQLSFRQLHKVHKIDDLGETIRHDLERLILGSLKALRHLADLWDQKVKLQVTSAQQQLVRERERIIA